MKNVSLAHHPVVLAVKRFLHVSILFNDSSRLVIINHVAVPCAVFNLARREGK